MTDIQQTFWQLLLTALVFGGIGFVVVLMLVPAVIRLFAATPSGRRELHQTHKLPVPRFGGLALVTAFVVATVASFLVDEPHPGGQRIVLGVTSLLMFGLGFWDDCSPLGAKKKLIGQILIASLAFGLGLQVDTFKNPLTGEIYQLGVWSGFATVFWLVALTNLINLIDGIDGLASGIALMLMCLLVYVSFHGTLFSLCIAMGMAGALVAFLFFNFPPAKIYLGDGGAYFLGFLIGGMTIQSSNKGTIAAALIAPIFALALPILDVSFSVLRRGMQGLPLFRPDQRHIHHRLLHAGLSRRKAVLTLYGISLLCLALAFVAFWSEGRLAPVLFGCLFMVLLIIAPSLGLVKSWFSVGATIGSTIEMRKDIQYALVLRNWLELEAERAESLAGLWHDFTFAAEKLGFTSVALTHRGLLWEWAARPSDGGDHTTRHDLHVKDETLQLDLSAPREMEEKAFYLLAELTAETWVNVTRRWTKRAEFPVAQPAAPEIPARPPSAS